MKIAHIADLHFSHFSLNPLQFFSKRWIGNFNLLLFRKKEFITERLKSLVQVFQEEGVTHVIITGDLTTTSLKKEYLQAVTFVEALKQAGLKVFALPGNHDHYTKIAKRKNLFFKFFDFHELQQIAENLWLICLDTTDATALHLSTGIFSEKMERELEEKLSSIPKKHRVIIANHFPLFDNEGPRKALKRADALRELLSRFPNVILYLHGHSHRHSIADLRVHGLPILVDSGSATHRVHGSWNLIDLTDRCTLQVFNWKEEDWKKSRETTFELV